MSETTKPNRRKLLLLFAAAGLGGAVIAIGIALLLLNISGRKHEGENPYFRVVDLDEDTVDPAVWGKNFPNQYDGYQRTVDQVRTRYGGSEAVPRTPTEADPRSVVAQSRLEEDPRYSRVLILDVRNPRPEQTHPGAKLAFYNLDLTQPTVDDDLATLLDREQVDTVVHGAFLSHPTHAQEWAHELEDVGTMHVLNACAGVEPRRFVMVSTTLVYGAHAKNPNFLTEDAELRGHRDSRFVNDKVRAEKQVQRFAQEHPNVEVCILRFAPILGPTISNMYTRFFTRPVAPVMITV